MLLLVHGLARLAQGVVDDFGGFLDGTGVPAGGVPAWGITAMEGVGGLLLAAGRWTRLLWVYFAVQLSAGIVYTRRRAGS